MNTRSVLFIALIVLSASTGNAGLGGAGAPGPAGAQGPTGVATVVTVKAIVATQTARYALTGLALNDVVQQTDTTPATYWKVISTGNLNNSAGWSQIAPINANSVLYAAGSSELWRILKTRQETMRAISNQAVNQIDPSLLQFTSAAANSDNTITIQPGGSIKYAATNTLPLAQRWIYAVATTELPSGAINVYANSDPFNPYTNGVFTEPWPGVAQYVFTNSNSNYFNAFIVNTLSTPITIYYPVITTSAVDQPLIQSYAERVVVPSQPVADFDFGDILRRSSDRTNRYVLEKQATIAADSVTGASGNAGSLYAPKLSLQQTLSAGSIFGLYRGSTFRESLPLSASGTAKGIVIEDLAFGLLKDLPIVSALDPAPGASFVSNGDGTYSYTWTTESTVSNNGYENVYAVEVNTATEPLTPIASRHRLNDVASQAAAAAAAGSVYIQSLGSNQWKATVRPSDSLAPGSGIYRYEVVARFSPANWVQTSVRDGGMAGVQLVGSSHGYGDLGAPVAFVGDRLILQHGSTHDAVIGGGSLQRSMLYETGDNDSIMLAFYYGTPAGLRFDLRSTIFYAQGGQRSIPPYFVIAHSSGGQNFDRGDISECAMIGGRWPDGSLRGTGIDYVNVNGGVINRNYVQGVSSVISNGAGFAGVEVKNNVFRQIGSAFMPLNFHDNIVAAESRSDPANVNNRGTDPCFLNYAGSSVQNNLFWSRSVAGLDAGNGAVWLRQASGVVTGTASRNIVALDGSVGSGAGGGAAYAVFSTATAQAGFAMDYNLVLYLGGGFTVFRSGGGTINTWAGYLATYPALDQHSLFIDLSTDPRGIKAVFVDPVNGDFRWAQTDVAKKCADYCKANNVGPAAVTSRWPVVPTPDEAARIITNL